MMSSLVCAISDRIDNNNSNATCLTFLLHNTKKSILNEINDLHFLFHDVENDYALYSGTKFYAILCNIFIILKIN